MNRLPPNALTVAGSDSGGGAGIQADLKTFSALGAYGASVITALTAQNTHGVGALHLPDAGFVAAQLDAVLSDLRIDAVKIGMLGDQAIVEAVATGLERHRVPFLVLDTVMLSKSGHALLAPAAVAALRERLLPLADLITPNLPEAAALLGVAPAEDETEMVRQGHALIALGARAVLMKGGHLAHASTHSPDWLIRADGGAQRFDAPRLAARHTHGTGCTLSAAIAALMPQVGDLARAVEEAKAYVSAAIAASARIEIGTGIGPVHHFHRWW